MRVAPAKKGLGQAAGPRTLHTSWSMLHPPGNPVVNVQFQSVAVSQANKLDVVAPSVAGTAGARAAAPFVILQAASLQ